MNDPRIHDLNAYRPQPVEAPPVTTEQQIPARRAIDNPVPMRRAADTLVPPAAGMPDLGILNPFVADDSIQEIMVNGLSNIYIDQHGQMIDAGVQFGSHDELAEVAKSIMTAVGQYWDRDRPMLDTRLADGSRVNLIGPPMAVDGVSMSIRKFPKHRHTFDSMVERGQLTPEIVLFLRKLVEAKVNIIVAGSTSSGKTTLLNALSGAIGNHERLVTIEDSAELQMQQPHVVRLEAKRALSSARADTAVTIRDLVKNALRMRPDRIIVGECRGDEAFDMLQAMNTGHDGSMTTLHANTPRDALARLETMVSLAVPLMPMRMVRGQIASSVNILIQMNRGKDGTRRLTYISEIAGAEGDMIMMQDLVQWNDQPALGPIGYRWMAGSSRNPHVTDAAREAGFLRSIR